MAQAQMKQRGDDLLKRSAGDEMMASYNEMRVLLRTLYERTGDLALLPILDRADGALRMLRGVTQTR